MQRSNFAAPDGPLTLSIPEASAISGFSQKVIRTAIRRGELPSLMPHGYVRGRRVRRTDLFKWMKEMVA